MSVQRAVCAASDSAMLALTTNIYGVASDSAVFPFSVVAPNQSPLGVAKIEGADTATKVTVCLTPYRRSCR